MDSQDNAQNDIMEKEPDNIFDLLIHIAKLRGEFAEVISQSQEIQNRSKIMMSVLKKLISATEKIVQSEVKTMKLMLHEEDIEKLRKHSGAVKGPIMVKDTTENCIVMIYLSPAKEYLNTLDDDEQVQE